MKIVHIITAFGIGGAEKLLLNVMNRQINEHQVFLIYFKNKNDLLPFLDSRIQVKQIPLSVFSIRNLKRFYSKMNPDIIHTHLGHADFLGAWSTRKTNIPLYCTLHNIFFTQNFIDSIYFKIYRLLFLKIRPNTVVISISKSVENHVLERLQIPKKRSILLLNAIPAKDIIRTESNHKNINLLFVGRLEKQKSIETLLKAIWLLQTKKLKKTFQLSIVGGGSLKSQLELLTKQLQIENYVRFKGEQINTDRFYATSDIFILPSIWEGFGIVILEAFRAKVAVIASNIEGPAELISHNTNGLLFEPKNQIQLAEQLAELIDNQEKREGLAVKGQQTFTQKYHIDGYVNVLNTLYKNA